MAANAAGKYSRNFAHFNLLLKILNRLMKRLRACPALAGQGGLRCFGVFADQHWQRFAQRGGQLCTELGCNFFIVQLGLLILQSQARRFLASQHTQAQHESAVGQISVGLRFEVDGGRQGLRLWR